MNRASYMCVTCSHNKTNNPYCEYCYKGDKYEKASQTEMWANYADALYRTTNPIMIKEERVILGIYIKKVVFNPPATIVFWRDGSKTVVKTQDGDVFDPEKGLAMAISKKAFGNTGSYFKEFKKWLPKENNVKFGTPIGAATVSLDESCLKIRVDDAKVSDDAVVSGNAKVYGNAIVYDDAKVSGFINGD